MINRLIFPSCYPTVFDLLVHHLDLHFVPWFAEELTILPGMSGAMVEANPVVEEYAVHFNKKQDCNYEEKAFCCRNDVQSEDIATRSKTDAGLPCYYPISAFVTYKNN